MNPLHDLFIKAISKRSLFLLAVCICFELSIFAQGNMIITGQVIDVNKEPIIGATVQDENNKNGVITDMDGKFNIKVSSRNATLNVSYIGMKSQNVKTNGRKQLTIVLEEESVAIDEVVVTALGIKRESKALGYAVTEVKSDNLTAGRENNLMSALSGKVPGVDISTTGGGVGESTRVTIRGNSQLSGSNAPLYVIDGVPMDNTQLGSANENGGIDYGDGISSLSPDNIESISVLKGASAAALYGSRASNGVILITTKSGQKKQGLGIEFSSNISMVKLLSGFDDYQRVYGQGRNGIPPLNEMDAKGTTMSAWGGRLDANLPVLTFDGSYRPYGNVENNILSFFRTGFATTNSVALSSGTETSTFRVSVSDMRNNDIVPSSKMNRTSFTVRGSTQLGKKMGIEARVDYTIENVNNRPGLSDDPSNIGNSIIGLAPNLDQRWLGDSFKDEHGRYIDWNGNNIYRTNPYWVINEMRNKTKRNRIIAFINYHYDILPYLKFQFKVGTDSYNFQATEFSSKYTPTAPGGEMTITQRNVREDNYEAMLRFNKSFLKDRLDITAFIAGNIRRNESDKLINKSENEVVDGLMSITNYSNPYSPQHALIKKQVNSIYGALNIGWDDYAYIDFTLRNDVSSTLSKANRSYIYPSASGSFIFSRFLNIENSILSFGKVRASWAKVGGDTDPYQLNLSYGLSNVIFQGTSLGVINASKVPYRDLKPTSTYSYEFGTDLRFFKGRLLLDLGYYFQTTKNQILGLPVSVSTGYSKAMINAGEIQNKGIEMALSFVPVQTKNFEWESTINLAKNKNNVKSLHKEVKDYQLAAARWGNAFIYASEGQPYGVIVGPGFKRDPDGNVIFKNGLPTYDSDIKVLGNGTYDFTLGVQQSFHYKGLSLSVLFDMKWGADLYSMSARQSHANGTSKETLRGRAEWYESEEHRKANNVSEANWTATGGFIGEGVMNIGTNDNPVYVPNTVAINPQTYWTNVTSNTAEPFIYDASFIKLREMNISYQFPIKWFSKTPIRSLSLSLYGRNLFTFYKNVKNIDPESNYSNGNGQGLEYGSLPSRRSFGFGLNLKF